MFRFGITADKDSIFIGGEPGRTIGLHVDHPWSDCSRLYGAPYRAYIRWWPGKMLQIPLRFLGEPADPFTNAKSFKRVKIVKRCGVEGCDEQGDGITDPVVFEEHLH